MNKRLKKVLALAFSGMILSTTPSTLAMNAANPNVAHAAEERVQILDGNDIIFGDHIIGSDTVIDPQTTVLKLSNAATHVCIRSDCDFSMYPNLRTIDFTACMDAIKDVTISISDSFGDLHSDATHRLAGINFLIVPRYHAISTHDLYLLLQSYANVIQIGGVHIPFLTVNFRAGQANLRD